MQNIMQFMSKITQFMHKPLCFIAMVTLNMYFCAIIV